MKVNRRPSQAEPSPADCLGVRHCNELHAPSRRQRPPAEEPAQPPETRPPNRSTSSSPPSAPAAPTLPKPPRPTPAGFELRTRPRSIEFLGEPPKRHGPRNVASNRSRAFSGHPLGPAPAGESRALNRSRHAKRIRIILSADAPIYNVEAAAPRPTWRQSHVCAYSLSRYCGRGLG